MTATPPPDTPSAYALPEYPPLAPMSAGRRARRTGRLLVLFLPFVAFGLLAEAAGWLSDNVTFSTDPNLSPEPTTTRADASPWWTDVLLFASWAVYVGHHARKVDYRWRDGLMCLVPIWGLLITVKLLWRVTALPERRWPGAAQRRRSKVDDLIDRFRGSKV